jgi:DNA (cytosine-5)-methyltransferase 1
MIPHMIDGRLEAIDLFAGAGGLTLGLQSAGFKVVAAVELDPLAAAAYAENHPEVEFFREDIRLIDPLAVAEKCGLETETLALVAGCPPCQGFSSMRTLNGARRVKDPRNALIDDYVRFVRVLRPRAILMENVPGLARDSGFSQALDELEKLGYPAKQGIRVLNAADYRVAQRRRRLVLVSAREGVIPFPEPVTPRRTVRDVIGALPRAGKSGDELHDLPENRTPAIRKLIQEIPKNGGSRGDVEDGHKLACHDSFDGFRDVYGRMSWDDVAPTITTGCFNPSKGRFLHPEHNRAITMREAALLQGFPARYKFPLRRGKSGVAELIGNALPPPFVKAHAQQIRKHLLSA